MIVSPALVTFHHAILWANGLDRVEPILDALQSREDFEIRHLESRTYPSTKAMVANAYAFDSAPAKHLHAKTRYLERFGAKALHIVLVRFGADFGTEKIAGKVSTFDPVVRNLKWQLRERFNPRDEAGEMTHEHVLHISDSSGIASKSLQLSIGQKFLKLSSNIDLLRLGFPVPWHLNNVEQVTLDDVPVEDLRARILTQSGVEVVPVSDTPHFRSAKSGNFAEYREYLARNRGVRLTDWYSVQKFSRILSTETWGNSFPILVRHFSQDRRKRFLILDGVHRAVAQSIQGARQISAAITGKTDE